MKFILDEEEYDDLVPSFKLKKAYEAIKKLRQMVVGHRCIHAEPKLNVSHYRDCSECPLSHLTWGELIDRSERPKRDLSMTMCCLDRRYSK
jgi:hypothetical protein